MTPWRFAGMYLAASWRLYIGPAAWGRFPKSVAFSSLAAVVAVALYALDGVVSGLDRQTLLLNAGGLAALGVLATWVRGDMRWNAAIYGVMTLGLLVAIPLDGLSRLLQSNPLWGNIPSVMGWLSSAWSAWFLVTAFRLAVAKVLETNHRHPLGK